jgi:DNA processing protein
MLSIVGSRNASLNALNLTRNLAHEIGAAGFNILSGMAQGIDDAGHEGSLDTSSIAVMAGGIDQVYPKENAKLYESLKHEGLILSEMSFGMQPFAQHFHYKKPDHCIIRCRVAVCRSQSQIQVANYRA